ncbi:MAG: hypothetical protein H6708_13150 [Kofleriaceae bacterium]|nr:hypothetical protein [Kofleriaceae bacterium]
MADPALPFPEALCHRCRHLRRVVGKRSVFLQCTEPSLPKYPPQPVRRCPGFVAAPPTPPATDPRGPGGAA